MYGWNNPVTHSDPTGLKPGGKAKGKAQHKKAGPPPYEPPGFDDIPTIEDALEAIGCPSGDFTACTQYPTQRFADVMEDWGFNYQGDGIYKSSPDAWQLQWGYHLFMDWIHAKATEDRAAAEFIQFDYDGTSYRVWWWNGFYLNLGNGQRSRPIRD